MGECISSVSSKKGLNSTNTICSYDESLRHESQQWIKFATRELINERSDRQVY